jgi:hypothetical protein
MRPEVNTYSRSWSLVFIYINEFKLDDPGTCRLPGTRGVTMIINQIILLTV